MHLYFWYKAVLQDESLEMLTDLGVCLKSVWHCARTFSLLLVCVWLIPIAYLFSWSDLDHDKVRDSRNFRKSSSSNVLNMSC